MGRLRFRIIDLVLLVMASAVGLDIWRGFTYSFKDDLAFATYLTLLSTAALGLWPRGGPSRPFFAGCAAFGALYLVLGLRLGFAYALGAKSEIGIRYGFIAGVAGGPLGLRTRPTADNSP